MEQAYWQARYTEGSTGWDLGEISRPLKAYIDQLSDKTIRILIPGCGFGHEAIYLSKQKFTHITVIDLVDEAMATLRENAPDVSCITGDFFDHNGQYDLILEQTLFCAIDPKMRQDYVKKIAELLTPTGKYVGVLFNRAFEGGPPFGGSIEEYHGYMNGCFSSISLENCYNSIEPRQDTEAFVIARR